MGTQKGPSGSLSFVSVTKNMQALHACYMKIPSRKMPNMMLDGFFQGAFACFWNMICRKNDAKETTPHLYSRRALLNEQRAHCASYLGIPRETRIEELIYFY